MLIPFGWPVIAGALLAVAAAGLLRGFTGYGFGLAASPLLSLMLPPVFVVPVVLFLQVGSSLVGLKHSLAACDRRSTIILSFASVVTTPLGVLLLQHMNIRTARLCIALVTAIAAVVLLIGARRRKTGGSVHMLPFGLVAGVLAGLCAMPAPPILAYYLGADMPPLAARSSMILIFLATGMLVLITNMASGGVGMEAILLSAVCAPLMVLGTIAGSRLFEIAPAHLYRPVGIGALAIIASSAAVRMWV